MKEIEAKLYYESLASEQPEKRPHATKAYREARYAAEVFFKFLAVRICVRSISRNCNLRTVKELKSNLERLACLLKNNSLVTT